MANTGIGKRNTPETTAIIKAREAEVQDDVPGTLPEALVALKKTSQKDEYGQDWIDFADERPLGPTIYDGLDKHQRDTNRWLDKQRMNDPGNMSNRMDRAGEFTDPLVVNYKKERSATDEPLRLSAGDETHDVTDELIEGGFRFVDPRQDPAKNIQDLLPYEAERRHGLLDEELRGYDPVLSPIRGAEDAASDIFALTKAFNQAIDEGFIKASKVGGAKLKSALNARKDAISKSRETAQKNNEIFEEAERRYNELAEANENMMSLGGTRVQQIADKEIESNIEKMKALEKLLSKRTRPFRKAAPEDTSPAADSQRDSPYRDNTKKVDKRDEIIDIIREFGGQGGPGFAPVAPPQVNQNLDTLVMPNPVVGAVAPKENLGFQKRIPGQSMLDYLTGTRRVDNNPAWMPALKTLDTATPANQVNEANRRLSETKKGLFQKLIDNVSSAVKQTSSKAMATTPTVSQGPVNQGNPIVMGFNIGRYATDPHHETKVAKIVSAVGNLSTSSQIETYIRGRFPKSPVTGTMVAASANKHGVPASMIIAMIQQDSSIGTAGLGARTNNPGNVGNDDEGNIRTYPSWSAGVDAVAAWLAKNRSS